MSPADHLPLSPPAYHVLLALGDGILHGYAIMRAFEDLTGGEASILPGTLYATIARMQDAGMLEEADPPVEERAAGPSRRYYRVTPFGRSVARAESERMGRLLEVARRQDLLPRGAR